MALIAMMMIDDDDIDDGDDDDDDVELAMFGRPRPPNSSIAINHGYCRNTPGECATLPPQTLRSGRRLD